jgi:Tfp pilus assembly ATPase PilU
MLNSRARTVKTSDVPLHTRNVSGGIPVRNVVMDGDSNEDFETAVRLAKQKEQEQLESESPHIK